MSGMSAATRSAQTIAPPAPPLSHLPCWEGGTTGFASSATSSVSMLLSFAASTTVTASCQVVRVYAIAAYSGPEAGLPRRGWGGGEEPRLRRRGRKRRRLRSGGGEHDRLRRAREQPRRSRPELPGIEDEPRPAERDALRLPERERPRVQDERRASGEEPDLRREDKRPRGEDELRPPEVRLGVGDDRRVLRVQEELWLPERDSRDPGRDVRLREGEDVEPLDRPPELRRPGTDNGAVTAGELP